MFSSLEEAAAGRAERGAILAESAFLYVLVVMVGLIAVGLLGSSIAELWNDNADRASAATTLVG